MINTTSNNNVTPTASSPMMPLLFGGKKETEKIRRWDEKGKKKENVNTECDITFIETAELFPFGQKSLMREYLDSYSRYQNSVYRPHDVQFEIAMIKDKIKRMCPEAEKFLLSNDMLRHFTSDMIEAILNLLKENLFDKNEIEIFWYRDREVEDWENLCISIKLKAKAYKEVIEYMNVVGKELDVLKNEPKYHDNSHEINKMISIIVDEL